MAITLYNVIRGCPLTPTSNASVAQLVEQRIRNAWVRGSSPLGSFKVTVTILILTVTFFMLFLSPFLFQKMDQLIKYNGNYTENKDG